MACAIEYVLETYNHICVCDKYAYGMRACVLACLCVCVVVCSEGSVSYKRLLKYWLCAKACVHSNFDII